MNIGGDYLQTKVESEWRICGNLPQWRQKITQELNVISTNTIVVRGKRLEPGRNIEM